MAPHILHRRADLSADEVARLDGLGVTDAMTVACTETPRETARRILAEQTLPRHGYRYEPIRLAIAPNASRGLMLSPDETTRRLAEVQTAVTRAARDVSRDPASVALVAVSKIVPPEGIEPALAAGQRLFGENYVQEAAGKWPALRERYPETELHLIGPLQSNKARDAVRLFDVIQSLDRPSLAKALAAEIQRAGRQPRLMVQVNTGEEPQKGGVLPGDIDAFLSDCRTVYGFSIEGLMCIPPAQDPPSPHFGLVNRIAARHGLASLSMGMSADFEAAIQMGATHVRVGTAIFGARPAA